MGKAQEGEYGVLGTRAVGFLSVVMGVKYVMSENDLSLREALDSGLGVRAELGFPMKMLHFCLEKAMEEYEPVIASLYRSYRGGQSARDAIALVDGDGMEGATWVDLGTNRQRTTESDGAALAGSDIEKLGELLMLSPSMGVIAGTLGLLSVVRFLRLKAKRDGQPFSEALDELMADCSAELDEPVIQAFRFCAKGIYEKFEGLFDTPTEKSGEPEDPCVPEGRLTDDEETFD